MTGCQLKFRSWHEAGFRHPGPPVSATAEEKRKFSAPASNYMRESPSWPPDVRDYWFTNVFEYLAPKYHGTMSTHPIYRKAEGPSGNEAVFMFLKEEYGMDYQFQKTVVYERLERKLRAQASRGSTDVVTESVEDGYVHERAPMPSQGLSASGSPTHVYGSSQAIKFDEDGWREVVPYETRSHDGRMETSASELFQSTLPLTVGEALHRQMAAASPSTTTMASLPTTPFLQVNNASHRPDLTLTPFKSGAAIPGAYPQSPLVTRSEFSPLPPPPPRRPDKQQRPQSVIPVVDRRHTLSARRSAGSLLGDVLPRWAQNIEHDVDIYDNNTPPVTDALGISHNICTGVDGSRLLHDGRPSTTSPSQPRGSASQRQVTPSHHGSLTDTPGISPVPSRTSNPINRRQRRRSEFVTPPNHRVSASKGVGGSGHNQMPMKAGKGITKSVKMEKSRGDGTPPSRKRMKAEEGTASSPIPIKDDVDVEMWEEG